MDDSTQKIGSDEPLSEVFKFWDTTLLFFLIVAILHKYSKGLLKGILCRNCLFVQELFVNTTFKHGSSSLHCLYVLRKLLNYCRNMRKLLLKLTRLTTGTQNSQTENRPALLPSSSSPSSSVRHFKLQTHSVCSVNDVPLQTAPTTNTRQTHHCNSFQTATANATKTPIYKRPNVAVIRFIVLCTWRWHKTLTLILIPTLTISLLT